MIYATRPLSELQSQSVPLGEEFREPSPHMPPDEPDNDAGLGSPGLQGLTMEESARVMRISDEDRETIAAIAKGSGTSKLPDSPDARKSIPLCTGLLDYFPDALAAVAMCSEAGRRQHHPDQPLHWERDKSADHADCVVRHLVDRGKLDKDGERHSAKVAWRALALLQLEIENDRPGK